MGACWVYSSTVNEPTDVSKVTYWDVAIVMGVAVKKRVQMDKKRLFSSRDDRWKPCVEISKVISNGYVILTSNGINPSIVIITWSLFWLWSCARVAIVHTITLPS